MLVRLRACISTWTRRRKQIGPGTDGVDGSLMPIRCFLLAPSPQRPVQGRARIPGSSCCMDDQVIHAGGFHVPYPPHPPPYVHDSTPSDDCAPTHSIAVLYSSRERFLLAFDNSTTAQSA